MLTDKDIEKLEKSLIPKLEQALVTKLLKAFGGVFATKDDLRQLRDQVEERLTEFRNDILSHVDAVYKELMDYRIEQAAHTHAHMRQDENQEDHEKRIRRLESVVPTS